MIEYFKPSFGKEEEQAALRVIRSGHLTQGKEVELFEQEFAEYIKAPYVVAVDNCTNALFLALAYENRRGRLTVNCPVMTFASVPHSILQTGHFVNFTDEYWAGEKYQLKGTNIWDCAHEIQRGMYQPGQVFCYSFYPNKVLGSAEGGAIATDNEDMAKWLRLARSMGREARSYSDYDIKFVGWKMNMTDMQAAIAREQLKKLDSNLLDREVIASAYRNEFAQLNGGNYLYVIKVADRNKFMVRMADNGIMTSFHYKPLYEQEAYHDPEGDKKYPYIASIKNQIVTLPLYPALKNREVLKIIKTTKKYINAKA